MNASKIIEDECITFNTSLPIMRIFKGFIKREKLCTNFKYKFDLNEKNFQYVNWRKCIMQTFNHIDTKGKMFLDSPFNFFHNILLLGLLEKNNKEKIKILQKWNNVILNIFSLDEYTTMFINALYESNAYDTYKQICDTFYKKDNTDEEIKEIIKQNRIQTNYNLTLSFFNYNSCHYKIFDKKQFRSLTKKEKKQYDFLLFKIPTRTYQLMIKKLIDYSIGIMCEKEMIKIEVN